MNESLAGLLAGMLLGWLVFGLGQAHGADKLILNDGRVPKYIYTADVGAVLWDWDHALEDRGSEAGLRWKDNLSRYLEGLVTGYYVASENMSRDHGIPIFCMGDGKRTILGGEIVEMLKQYQRINPASAHWGFQAAVYHVLMQYYPCPYPHLTADGK